MADSGRWQHVGLRLLACAVALGGLGGLALSWFEDGADHYYRNGLWRIGLEGLRAGLHRSLVWAVGIVAVAWLVSRLAIRGGSHSSPSASPMSPWVASVQRLGARIARGLSPVIDRMLVPTGAICATAIIAIELVTAWGFSEPAESAPNIVLITVDTFRADHLGSYGYHRATSPQLDELAARGVRFDRAWSQAPWTLPSMATAHTSLYPSQHRAVEAETSLSREWVTLAEVFQNAGYRTLAVVSHLFVGSRLGFDQGFDVFDESNALGDDAVTSPQITVTALKALSREKLKSRPFLLWVHYFDPHFSYVRQRKFGFADGYRGTLRPPIQASKLKELEQESQPSDIAFIESIYDEEVAFTDEWIGQLVRGVNVSVGERPTFFFVTGDHGEYFMEHERLGHGRDVYEELIRVPLIVAGDLDPALQGRVVKETVELASLARTITRLAGLNPERFGGEDLLGLARSGGEPRLSFSEGIYAWGSEDRKLGVVSRDGWKMIHNLDRETFELYHLGDDPGELTNLWGAEDADAVAAGNRLQSALREFDLQSERPAATIELTDEERVQLRALGYAE
jgi:arylsulfatase A-like enzyme